VPNSEAPLLSRRDGELLRTLASTLVVVIHCTSIWVKDFYATRDFLTPGFFVTILDQLSRFTVPAFFFLSGYGLAQQFMIKSETVGQFYRRRLLKISAPFFVWSALTFYRPLGYFTTLPWTDDPLRALAGFLDFLLLKGFDYQYYFLIVIFQFYLVFPFIYRASGRGAFVLATLALQLLVMSPIEGYLRVLHWQLPPLYSYLLVFYMFYFVAGIYAARHNDLFAGLLARATHAQVWAFWGLSLALTVAEYWVNISVLEKPLAYADHFNRWVVILYCFATLLVVLKHRVALHARVHANPRWEFFYKWFGPYSFFVYLAHTHFLRLADLFLHGLNPLFLPARVLFVLLCSYLLAWVLMGLLKRWSNVRLGLGLPSK
jgi:hypothetical protein